jgi:glutathione S-transferase
MTLSRSFPPAPVIPAQAGIHAHPFSSYCQKVLVTLWENGTPFAYRHMEEPGAREELARLWPIAKFPVLVDGDRAIVETSIIIEPLHRQL